jgi:hypothetical protein
MTREDLIPLIQEAVIVHPNDNPFDFRLCRIEVIERFAALVAAEKEAQMIRDGWRQCAEGQRTTEFCGLLDAAVKAEQNRCCKIVYGMAGSDNVAQRTVEKIREQSR